MKSYLIEKYHEPEHPEALKPLSAPDSFELKANEPGRVVERRDLTPEEAQEVKHRTHIKLVEEEGVAHAVQNEDLASEFATYMTAKRIAAFHGISKVTGEGQGEGHLVTVIDTGISEELYAAIKAQVVSIKGFISGENAWDYKSKHGSYCISVVAGHNPKCKVRSSKGLSTETGSAPYSVVIAAIEDAVEAGSTEINMSLGGPGSQILDNAVNSAAAKGIKVFVAAGNDQRNSSAMNADQQSPARASGAITCGACDSDEIPGEFSNWGNSLKALGAGVKAECPHPKLVPGGWNGSSMGTPHVLASYIAANVEISTFLKACRDTARPAYKEGNGIADAEAAVALKEPEPKPEPKPSNPNKRSIDDLKRIRSARRKRITKDVNAMVSLSTRIGRME